MNESLRKKLVFGLLAVAIVWGIWNNPFKGDDVTDLGGSSVDPGTMLGDTLTDVIESGPSDVDYAVAEEWGSDPFPRSRTKAIERSTEPVVRLKLSAISASGGSYMAIINGSVVSENSTIEGWKVASISSSEVTLNKSGRSKKLKVGR